MNESVALNLLGLALLILFGIYKLRERWRILGTSGKGLKDPLEGRSLREFAAINKKMVVNSIQRAVLANYKKELALSEEEWKMVAENLVVIHEETLLAEVWEGLEGKGVDPFIFWNLTRPADQQWKVVKEYWRPLRAQIYEKA